MKTVSVITVNFNQPAVTEALLDSLLHENRYPALEIIVVDNGSRQDPTQSWQTRYPGIIFIRSEKNLGFAGGNNLGIRKSTGEFVFLINNDTIVTPSLIGTLANTLGSQPRAGAVSPKIRYFDQPDLLQYVGYTPINFITCRNACIGQFEEDRGQYDGPARTTAYVHGAAMMLKREVLKKADLMDENYFLYYEELDWCERIRQAGYLIYVDPGALIYHKESVSVSKTTGLKEFFMNRNRILFVRKNADPLRFFFFCLYFGIVVVPRNLLNYLVSGEKQLIPVFLKAIAWHFSNSPDSPRLGYPLPVN